VGCVSASLSTHVLDTGRGEPARGVRVELSLGGKQIASATTDADGRVKEIARELEPGRYTLVFHPPSPFFRRIELEVALEEGHYHVPLLVSPYSCASYRGS
jgi:5-hydroxyisourate hydrolase